MNVERPWKMCPLGLNVGSPKWLKYNFLFKKPEGGGGRGQRGLAKILTQASFLGALQIATAVPGLMASISGAASIAGSREESGRETPEELASRPSYGRQDSRGSLSGDMFKRRGSLPVCQSKRGSICAYSGGAMCESTPVGEVCEARMAMMKAETVTNGLGDNQEVKEISILYIDKLFRLLVFKNICQIFISTVFHF